MEATGLEGTLDERSQQVFRLLVERYIRDGKPVGSRTLSRDLGSDLSPATIRNVMADLEDLGLLRAPHTSAGRVPTALGYRLFVDTLLHVAPLESTQLEIFRTQLQAVPSKDAVLESASSLLSDVTRMAGLVMLPRHEAMSLRQVEFLSLSRNQVLAIFVINEREVQNRIIDTERHYTQDELQQAANYLNGICAGKDLVGVRERLLQDLSDYRENVNRMMQAAIEMADKAFRVDPEVDALLVKGQTNLMGYGELADMDKLRQLFDAFAEKQGILHLLDRSLAARGVQIFIGEESGYSVLDECSVVTAPYEADGEVLGVLGVIGPTRMAYDRVIPVVDVTARLLGAALKHSH